MAEFLELTPEESAYVELKVALGSRLKELSHCRRLLQVELAKRIGSSQSRVAKMETGGSPVERRGTGVAFDGLVRGL